MPLLPNARDKLRVNLQTLSIGKKPKPVVVGHLTAAQLAAINSRREQDELPAITDEVVFVGKHIYESRITKDGYSIDDVIDQIANGMDSSAVMVQHPTMSAIQNQAQRTDRYGSTVRDTIVFECAGRHPRPELYSVIPKGDVCPTERAKQAKK